MSYVLIFSDSQAAIQKLSTPGIVEPPSKKMYKYGCYYEGKRKDYSSAVDTKLYMAMKKLTYMLSSVERLYEIKNLGDVVNIISSREGHEYIPLRCLKLIGLYLAQGFGTFCYIAFLSSAGERMAFTLRKELYQNLVEQDMEFFDSIRTAELLECVFTDVQEFKSSFKQCVSQGVKNIFQICGSIISLIKISPGMTLTIVTVVPPVVVLGTLFGALLRKLSNAAQKQSVKVFSLCEESLSNIRTVRAFGNESLECERFSYETKQSSKLNSLLGHGIAFLQAGSNLFLNGLVLGTLYIGSQFIIVGDFSSGNLMSFLVTAQMIQKSFAQISMTFGHYLKGKQSFERICFYSNLKPSIPTKGGITIPYHSFIPNVEFKDVTFAYPSRPTQAVLTKLNLSLPAGKTVAVVGASGNGKSTIALLLERFYDINSGSITIGGINISDLDPNWLRSSAIGIINQEPVLFATSIKENIKYGKPTATDEEVYEAAKLANADEFIRSFPEGYETVVGERGVAISGGQKQRIAIARALIKKPAILILDEATSALDPEAEKVVQNTLERVCQGRTVLVIAHRLSTVKNADTIAVLQKGVILEMGTHKFLMNKKGVYYNLMNQENQKPRSFG
ncbi:mitochondrial potassium channel ATP-binding subunit isoform X2 [Halyomorpha halys]|uniref:mitochondrial potassium channel ATP-binding subunit isoform X2 n=1 Tax=Halyomorpha halys TaxID=286706 RepID=UPI0034D324E6